MSPELGIALVVALFWGPTALWLAYRVMRGQQALHPLDPSIEIYEPGRIPQRPPDEITAEIELDNFWVCATCRSLNLRAANRCYSCRAAKEVAGPLVPEELLVTRGIPVMAAAGEGRSASDVPERRGFPVIAAGQTRLSEGPSVERGVPVLARDLGASRSEPAHGSVAVAAPGDAHSISELPVRESHPQVSASRPEAPASAPVCPFIGWRDDPSTRYDFPDPANLCHATSDRATAPGSLRRQTPAGSTGRGKPQPIDPGHQGSLCLTASHVTCARYPDAEVVGGSR